MSIKTPLHFTLAMLFIANLTLAFELTPSFLAYIKLNEGFRATPYVCAGGFRTIGYGHNIAANRTAYRRLTEVEATKLLKIDLWRIVERLERKYGRLSDRQMEILTDYHFNLGSMRQFAKMERAVLNNDLQEMRREYKRYSKGKELRLRNQTFYDRYLR